MTTKRILQVVIVAAALGVLAWLVTRGLERLVTPANTTAGAAPAAPAEAPAGHITATLFYATEDGQSLVPVQREVPLAESVVAQGRQILAAQFEPAPSPYLSVIPPGTTLRAFYVTERGDAFVDVSPEISTAHPGGSFTELLTVYSIVNAVASNLPAVQRVQILIDGREADTIAGHVDIRRPLARDTSMIRDE